MECLIVSGVLTALDLKVFVCVHCGQCFSMKAGVVVKEFNLLLYYIP